MKPTYENRDGQLVEVNPVDFTSILAEKAKNQRILDEQTSFRDKQFANIQADYERNTQDVLQRISDIDALLAKAKEIGIEPNIKPDIDSDSISN